MARIHKGGGAKYKDALGTADYSVGDPPPATHVRGLVQAQNIAFLCPRQRSWQRVGRFRPQKKSCFLGVTNGVFGLKMLFLRI